MDLFLVVAEFFERGDEVGVVLAEAFAGAVVGGSEFAAEFEEEAFGGFFADAGDAFDEGEVFGFEGEEERFLWGVEDFEGDFWADAVDGKELFE